MKLFRSSILALSLLAVSITAWSTDLNFSFSCQRFDFEGCGIAQGFPGDPVAFLYFHDIADGWDITGYSAPPNVVDATYFSEFGELAHLYEEFPAGGGISITGPSGVTLSGILDSGTFSFSKNCEGCLSDRTDFSFAFDGRWSNGYFAAGGGDIHVTNPIFSNSDFRTGVTQMPEPSSVGLLMTGLVPTTLFLRRRFSSRR